MPVEKKNNIFKNGSGEQFNNRKDSVPNQTA